MTKISLAKIPKLPMPDKFQSITIRVTGVIKIKKKIIYICELYGTEEGIYQLTPTDAMQTSLINDLWVKDKEIDYVGFENIDGHILTVRGVEAVFNRKTKSGEIFKPKVYEFHLRDDIERIEEYGSKERLENVKLEIIEENKEVMNNKIGNMDNKTKNKGDKDMIETEGKCKYCGRDISVFQKTEEKAVHDFMWAHFPFDIKNSHPNFKVVTEGDNIIAIDNDNGKPLFKTNKEKFMDNSVFESLFTKRVRHSCCVNCGWTGEYKNLKIIEVVDRERDQCSFGCPDCNHVFHTHVLMGQEAKEGITLDSLGYELDFYRQ